MYADIEGPLRQFVMMRDRCLDEAECAHERLPPTSAVLRQKLAALVEAESELNEQARYEKVVLAICGECEQTYVSTARTHEEGKCQNCLGINTKRADWRERRMSTRELEWNAIYTEHTTSVRLEEPAKTAAPVVVKRQRKRRETPAPKQMRKCVKCKCDFWGRSTRQKYCRECSPAINKVLKRPRIVICKECGAAYKWQRTHCVYCSVRCNKAARRRQYVQRLEQARAARGVQVGQCKCCGAEFAKKFLWHVYCCAACAKLGKRKYRK